MGTEEQSSNALIQVLENTNVIDSSSLFFAAAVAHKQGDITSAAYLFYIAKFRVQFDKNIFPPKGQGGNSPMVAFGALASQIGGQINPEIMRNPTRFAECLELVKKWQPSVPEDYEPGWYYIDKLSVKEAATLLTAQRKEFDNGMGNISELLNIPTYFEAFRVVQDYNMLWDESRPTDEQFAAAKQKLKEIERTSGIEGMYWKKEDDGEQ